MLRRFLRLNDVANTCKRMQHCPLTIRELFSAMAESCKKLKTSNVFSSIIV